MSCVVCSHQAVTKLDTDSVESTLEEVRKILLSPDDGRDDNNEIC